MLYLLTYDVDSLPSTGKLETYHVLLFALAD